MTSPLRPAWPRTLTFLTTTSAGPATSVAGASVRAGVFAAAGLALAAFFFLTTAFLAGAFVFTSGGAARAGAGAIIAGPEAGGGMAGREFVEFCAVAPAATITANISQQ